ncbi:hypothetical protein ACKLTP_17665, partial [Paenarthrobacter ureafaciens]
MTKKRNTVFITMDPNALPARSTKGWEYLLPCDEVEVTLPEGPAVVPPPPAAQDAMVPPIGTST